MATLDRALSIGTTASLAANIATADTGTISTVSASAHLTPLLRATRQDAAAGAGR